MQGRRVNTARTDSGFRPLPGSLFGAGSVRMSRRVPRGSTSAIAPVIGDIGRYPSNSVSPLVSRHIDRDCAHGSPFPEVPKGLSH